MEPLKNISRSESLFLEGRGNRWKDFTGAFRILTEFIRGFRQFHFLGPCASIFGSARFDEENEFYQKARQMSQQLAKRGFSIMTGGGPGIMEAANRGAKEAGGQSIGCNIILPHEQYANPYLDVMIEMDHFYVRKVLLLKYSYAYVVFPGGYGTMDELFETLVLIQTNKISHFPVILFGKKYWMNLWEQMEDMKNYATISKQDMDLFLLTDSVDEAVDYILHKLFEKFGTKEIRHDSRPRWWLLENFSKKRHLNQRHKIRLD